MIESLIATAILAVWCVYLLYQNQILVNKLMSRNYHEYQVAHTVAKQDDGPVTEDPDSGYDEQRAREINGIMGMGS